jgi:hypothetical protein
LAPTAPTVWFAVASRGRSGAISSIATGFFAHGVTSTEIVIAFVADPPGYIWSFPRPGHLAIGICAEATADTGSSSRADGRVDQRDRHRAALARNRMANSLAGRATPAR